MLKYVVVLMIVLAGAGAYAYQNNIISKPDFGVADRGDWGKVNETGAEVKTEVWINNENPVEASFDELIASYRLSLNGNKVAHGNRNGLSLEKGNETKVITTRINIEKLEDWWVGHLRKDEKSRLSATANLDGNIGPIPVKLTGIQYKDSIETDIEGMLDDAVSELREDYTYRTGVVNPEIQIRGGTARFGKVTDSETPINFRIKIHNPNAYPIPKPRTEGSITMNTIKLAEWREKESSIENSDSKLIQSGETETVAFHTDIKNQRIGDWLTSHADNNERSSGKINLKMIFEIQGVKITLPPGDGIECDFRVKTAILEDNQKQKTNFDGCNSDQSNSQIGDSDSGSEEENGQTDKSESDLLSGISP